MGDFTGVAHLGFRFNRDAEVLRRSLDAKTSTFLGAGFIAVLSNEFNWTGELTVETKRFREGDSDIRLTAGAQWTFSPHNTLRGGASVGLSDAAPDFELIGGYVYSF